MLRIKRMSSKIRNMFACACSNEVRVRYKNACINQPRHHENWYMMDLTIYSCNKSMQANVNIFMFGKVHARI
jgi:hypothetical protein